MVAASIVTEQKVTELFSEFNLTGKVTDIEMWTGGHINQTFLVKFRTAIDERRYVLQRVNSRVFPRLPELMDNAIRVAEHSVYRLLNDPATTKKDIERGALRFLLTSTGLPYIPDPEKSGDVWRVYHCIEGAEAHMVATREDEAYEAARAFGNFQRLLSDLPGGRLNDTIPNFHNTPMRFTHLMDAANKDVKGRKATVKDTLDAYMKRREEAGILQREFEAGAFPERTVHNDAKLSNVLIDSATRKAVCVIDLDTTMTGYALHDFGDLVRSICNPADEAETDTAKIQVRLPYFDALVKGYLESTRGVLTEREIELLPMAGWVITLETGVRFLTDYLNGDTYFRIKYPEQNLHRALSQLTFAQRLEDAMPDLNRIVATHRG